jgi:hypothetical protein
MGKRSEPSESIISLGSRMGNSPFDLRHVDARQVFDLP